MILEIREYSKNLQLLANLHIGKFLVNGSKDILINKAESLGLDIRKKRKNWRFSIPREHPLTFKESDRKLQIDISCEIEGTGDYIKKQNSLLRVWCLDENICYREGIDHPGIKNKVEAIGWKRVILRFHFDLRELDVKQPEPLYHLQVGGVNPTDDENCWHPEQIEVPRFPYPPMDIILLCEFVLMNFFPEDYEKLRKKPEWKSLVRKSQVLFQKDYFEMCWKCLNRSSAGTLMENLVTRTRGL